MSHDIFYISLCVHILYIIICTFYLPLFGGNLYNSYIKQFLFFFLGKIIRRIGYGNLLTFCFTFYAVRLYALSFISNPWWVLPIEFFLHGLSYALSYATVVEYASSVSTSAIRGTMQGLMSGIYDGCGE